MTIHLWLNAEETRSKYWMIRTLIDYLMNAIWLKRCRSRTRCTVDELMRCAKWSLLGTVGELKEIFALALAFENEGLQLDTCIRKEALGLLIFLWWICFRSLDALISMDGSTRCTAVLNFCSPALQATGGWGLGPRPPHQQAGLLRCTWCVFLCVCNSVIIPYNQ